MSKNGPGEHELRSGNQLGSVHRRHNYAARPVLRTVLAFLQHGEESFFGVARSHAPVLWQVSPLLCFTRRPPLAVRPKT